MHAMSRESWGVAGRESSACQEDILWFEVAEAKAHIVDSLERSDNRTEDKDGSMRVEGPLSYYGRVEVTVSSVFKHQIRIRSPSKA